MWKFSPGFWDLTLASSSALLGSMSDVVFVSQFACGFTSVLTKEMILWRIPAPGWNQLPWLHCLQLPSTPGHGATGGNNRKQSGQEKQCKMLINIHLPSSKQTNYNQKKVVPVGFFQHCDNTQIEKSVAVIIKNK